MIAYVMNRMRERALRKAHEACEAIAHAALVARILEDHGAARYFEAELQLANAKRDALLGKPNPGRYCCDHKCERQGRINCACNTLPRPAITQAARPWFPRVLLISFVALLWAGVIFSTT